MEMDLKWENIFQTFEMQLLLKRRVVVLAVDETLLV